MTENIEVGGTATVLVWQESIVHGIQDIFEDHRRLNVSDMLHLA